MEINVTEANFKDEILQSEVPVFVDFWAEWCGPCKMVAPTVEEIAESYQGKVKVCKINVDEAPNIAGEYEVMSIPTLAIFKQGELVEKTVGALPKDQIENMINKHL